MNKLIIPFILVVIFLSVGFSKKTNSSTPIIKTEKIAPNEELIINDALYNLKISVENSKDNQKYLIVSIELKNDSYFVSPNSKRDFTGKFFIDLGDKEYIAFEGKLKEYPLTKEEFDEHPFINGIVNLVRKNTIYKQKLYLNKSGDFQVFGRIKFVIEPRCTLEEIPFMIYTKSNKLMVGKATC